MIKKRKKSSRMHGSHTHSRGFKKKARGSGHRGGFGMAGTGKRADQKKTLVIKKYKNKYFGKSKTLRRRIIPKLKSINIYSIEQNLNSYVKKGIATSEKDVYTINLQKYKILSQGSPTKKLIIIAGGASKSAIEKIKKAGGEIKK